MARKSIDPSLAELAAKRSARRARLSKPERANDTRSKARLDAFFLPRFENASDPEFTNRLGDCFHRELPGLLTLDSDEALFADRFNAKHACDSRTCLRLR
ncbi:mobilization protein [Ensifer sp. 22521]|uniref:mobilization protein n=1 Tax=Ensifer sp. 22521 TaxID=3453935 RepID=UPI003F8692D2